MREAELRKHSTCAACGKKIGHAGVPIFWTVEIERHGLKRDALDRQMGLTQMLGGHARLASVMGPNEEMTTPLIKPVKLTICEPCSAARVCISQLVEAASEPDDEEEDGE
jgi:hypothetical protein